MHDVAGDRVSLLKDPKPHPDGGTEHSVQLMRCCFLAGPVHSECIKYAYSSVWRSSGTMKGTQHILPLGRDVLAGCIVYIVH